MADDFAHLEQPQRDPIFTLATWAMESRSARPETLDATAGTYMSEEGIPVIFPSTKQALRLYGESLHNQDISYPPLLGLRQFRAAVVDLIFGKQHSQYIATIATTGGTGALAINLKLLKYINPDLQVILPMPAYGNHPPLCAAAGLGTIEVPYVVDGQASVTGIIEALKNTSGQVALLIQAGCHNPIGLDLSPEQWQELIAACQEHDCIVLYDLAYQGFAGEPLEDSSVAHDIADAGVTLLVAWSASKNHTIYGLRTGLAAAVVPDEATKEKIEDYYSMITRGQHSAASTAGQWIVQLVQENHYDDWLADLKGTRDMLGKKREALKAALPAEFTPSLAGHGMFAILPLTLAEITTLREEHHVFLLENGRINIAGIPLRRMEEFADKILLVHN